MSSYTNDLLPEMEGASEREKLLMEANKALEEKYQRLKNEKELKEQELRREINDLQSQFKLLTDSLPVSVVYVDSDLNYQFANKTALEWRRGNRKDIVGKNVKEILGEDTYNVVRTNVETVLAGQPMKFENQLTYPDGTHYTDNYLIPHFVDGKVKGFFALVVDITDRIEARKEAERQRKRLYDLFMQAPAAICILSGPDLVFELVNPKYQQLFSGRELLGKPILEALPEIRNHVVYETFQNVYRTGITHEELGILVPIVRTLNGPLEDCYFNYIQQARFDENNNIDGVLVFAFEVTDQVVMRQKAEAGEQHLKELTTELAASNEEIRASNEELFAVNEQLKSVNSDLDNFVYAASHDLKAPISNIEGLMRALIRSLPEDVVSQEAPRKITEMIMTSVERFQKTIADLTTITKLQRNFNETPTLVAIKEVVEEVKFDLNPQIEEYGAQIKVDLSNTPEILFSRKNLRSIIYNLLSNALKYRSEERALNIEIRSYDEEFYKVLCVKDNGLGLNKADQTKMFEMFKRFHKHVEGSGIGLYIVKKIIDSAGGKIEVVSELGEGSEFKVYFKNV